MIAAFDFTFDPLDPILLVFNLGWFVVAAAIFGLAWKAKGEWTRAALSGFALSILGLQLLAILPSWWLYFADGRLGWGGQGCVELDASCLKQTAKDTVVVIENAVVLGGFVVAFLLWQKKFPKQLASGEAKSEATGGYK